MDKENFGKTELNEFGGKLLVELIYEKCRVDVLSDLLIKKDIITKDELNELFEESYSEKYPKHRKDIMQHLFEQN